MSDQLTFDDLPEQGKFQQHGQSETSREAAVRAPVKTSRRKVLEAFGRRANWMTGLLIEDLTDEEIQTRTGMNPSTERPRRVELVEMGLIEDSGVRRRTSSGRSAVVWKLTELGMREVLYG